MIIYPVNNKEELIEWMKNIVLGDLDLMSENEDIEKLRIQLLQTQISVAEEQERYWEKMKEAAKFEAIYWRTKAEKEGYKEYR